MDRSANKYGVNPNRLRGQKDILSHIIELHDQITQQGTAPRIGHTAIDDGNLVIRNGDIIVSEADETVVLRIKHGAEPEIRMWPLGDTDTHVASLFGYDFNNNLDNPDQAVVLYIAKNDLTPDGGKVLLSRSFAVLSHQPDGGEEMFLQLDPFGIWLQGKFANAFQSGTQDATYTGSIDISAGFGSWTHTYAAPFSTRMCPNVTLVSSAVVSWMVTAFSTSSFTTSWSGSTAKTLNFFNFRV